MDGPLTSVLAIAVFTVLTVLIYLYQARLHCAHGIF
jgi:hypothetical protein